MDVQWIDETVGKSKDKGIEESREAFNELVKEYRDYKRNYSKAFRFHASKGNGNFGMTLS